MSYAIIGANVVMFVFELLSPRAALALMLVPAHADLLHDVTSTFLHAGLFHLLGNLIFFYVSGPFIEDAWGRALFTLFYFSAAIVSSVVDTMQDPSSTTPRLGASGAIAAVMGAFLVRFGTRRIVFLWRPFLLSSWGSREFRVPAWLYLPFWFGASLLIATTAGDSSGVAEWAHVGGFVFGAVVALIVWATGFERRFIDPAVEGVVSQSDSLVKAMDESRSGRRADARRATAQILAADPRNVDARRFAYDLAAQYGDPAEIARTDGPLLDRYLELGEKDLARELINDVRRNWLASASARFLLRAGDFLAAGKDTADALAMYDRLVGSHPGDPVALKALLKITDLRRDTGDLKGALKAIELANRHPGCTPEWVDVFRLRRERLPA